MTENRSPNESPPPGAKPPLPKARRRRRAKKREALSKRLTKRLDEFATAVPYAENFARKLRPNPETVTLGDVIIDKMCMEALKGNATILRSLWERAEGRPAAPAEAPDGEPRCIRTPLPAPAPKAGR